MGRRVGLTSSVRAVASRDWRNTKFSVKEDERSICADMTSIAGPNLSEITAGVVAQDELDFREGGREGGR
jgi:hypothetical protein